MAEVLHRIRMKNTFLTISKEVMLTKSSEDFGDMFNVILFIQRKNENIIQIDDNKNIQKIRKNGVKKPLKARRGIGKSERHDEPLEGTIVSTKSSFPFITRRNPDEMVGMSEINLGKKLGFRGSR